MRDADIVNLAVISTRRGVNHAYFASIWCDASYMFVFFCSLFCETGLFLKCTLFLDDASYIQLMC